MSIEACGTWGKYWTNLWRPLWWTPYRVLRRRVSKATEGQVHYGVLMIADVHSLLVVGGSGYLNELITQAGGKNVMSTRQEAFFQASPEELLNARPEYILIPTRDEQAYTSLVGRYPGLDHTRAAVYKQVFIVDPDKYFRPGPRLIEALLELTQILHNDLQPDRFIEP